jgi:hypothetical protein
MKLKRLAEAAGCALITAGRDAEVEIRDVCGGDRISELLNAASPNTIIVTSLRGVHLVRLANLMDVPAICLASGGEADSDVLEMAERSGAAILRSPVGVLETCERIRACLGLEHRHSGLAGAKDSRCETPTK